jgi:hypothetical protein
MDDLTTQALDIVWENDAIKSKVKKATPYVAAFVLFQLLIFLMLVYLVQLHFRGAGGV